MTPLEDDLTAALTESGRGAPVIPDLAAAARERRRDRVRTRVAAVSVAAVAALIAGVAVAVPQLGDDSGPSTTTRTPDADFSGTAWIPDGWRSETVGDLEMAVPGEWIYGTISQWCVGAGRSQTTPIFERPGGVSTLVACAGDGGYGVRFHPRGVDEAEPMPDAATVRTVTVGDQTVVIVLESAALADQVEKTVHRVRGYDSNGCSPRTEVPRIGRAATVGATTGLLSVCRYDLQGRQGLLAQSERLDADGTASLRAAIAAAEPGRGPDVPASQCRPQGETSAILLSTAVGPLAWVHQSDCVGHGIDLGSSIRKLTSEVLYWALSPGWSGGVDGVDLTETRDLDSH